MSRYEREAQMNDLTIDKLTQRLDRLERENRRWRLASCLSALARERESSR